MKPRYRAAFRFLLAFLATTGLSGTSWAAPTYEEGYVEAGEGIRLFYQKLGSSPDVLIVPAGFYLFEDLKHLAAQRTLIFYDMRNRGRSSSTRDSSLIGIEHDVSDIEAVRLHFRLKRFELFGWSYLGLVTAMYTRDHPNEVKRLIMSGPAPLRWDHSYPDSLQYKLPADTVAAKVIEAAEKAGLYQQSPAKFTRLVFDLLERETLVADTSAWTRLGPQWGNQSYFSNEQMSNFMTHMGFQFATIRALHLDPGSFRNIRIPVLVIHGMKDNHCAFGSGKEWSELLPRARLLRVPSAGHIPWVENPALVWGAVRDFLAQR